MGRGDNRGKDEYENRLTSPLKEAWSHTEWITEGGNRAAANGGTSGPEPPEWGNG